MTMRRVGLAALAALSSVAVSSCSALNVNTLPAPGTSFTGGYEITMEFDNALNLPDRAKVTLDGRTVGVVTEVTVKAGRVDVGARIEQSVQVPGDIHAELQQATVLGDIYVALERPQNSGAPAGSVPALEPGAVIPLDRTTSPDQLEDTIARLADFTGSGSIQKIQTTIIRVNRVTPDQEKLRKSITQFSADMGDLANNIDTVDDLLTGISGTSESFAKWAPAIGEWYTQPGMTGFERSFDMTRFTGNVLVSIGSVWFGGFWLVPFLNSVEKAAAAIRDSKWAFEAEIHKWQRLLTDYFLPQDKYPAINITSITDSEGRELSGNIHDVLRILGAVE